MRWGHSRASIKRDPMISLVLWRSVVGLWRTNIFFYGVVGAVGVGIGSGGGLESVHAFIRTAIPINETFVNEDV